MEVRANNVYSSTLDSICTLIDTVSNRLPLVSFDYRGIDDLKQELTILRSLLVHAGHLNSSFQSSLLFPFSEELRFFYFILRSERSLIYRMVEEIARFRESVKGFQQQLCECNTCLLDEILDQLQPLVLEHLDGQRDDLIKLKVELKLMKLFYLCAINWRNQASLQCLLSKIKSGISEKAWQIYYHLLTPEDLLLNHELAQDVSLSRESLLCELYTSISDPLLLTNAYPWVRSELILFFDYLLECLGDIIIWGEALDPTIKQLIDSILKVIKFLNNFFRFSTLWVKKPQGFERFFIHCQVSAISAAFLGYMCWFHRYGDEKTSHELKIKCCELAKNIKPLSYQVTHNYVETLMTSRQSSSSYSLRAVADTVIVEEFVGFLVEHLREFQDTNASSVVNLDHRMIMLVDRLEWFRTLLKQQEEMLCDLNQGETDVLIKAVYEGAILSFQLSMLKGEEILEVEIYDRIYQLVENVDSSVLGRRFSMIHDSFHLPNYDTVVGFGAEAEDMKDILIRGSEELEIVAIMGKMGIGKTTLANKVYHSPAVKDHFYVRAWCEISRPISGEHILLVNSAGMPRRKYYVRGRSSFTEMRSVLKKKYLVVLDNVCGSEAVDLLKDAFPDEGNGSRILLTTRRNLPTINCASIKYLQPLNDYTCFELLKQKLEGSGQWGMSSQPLWPIAKLCRGVPVIVVGIAGILANLDGDSWEEVARSLSSVARCALDEYIHIVLELGYEHLADHLKPCLLYAAAFPRGQDICAKRLMWLWIAEGFVEKNMLKDFEDVAENYLMDVIRSNFIKVTKQGSTGNVRTCRVAHCVREFCLAKIKSKEKSFVWLIGEDAELSDVYKSPSPYPDRLFIPPAGEDLAESTLFNSETSGSSLLFHFKRRKSQLRSLVVHSIVGRSESDKFYFCELCFSFRLKRLRVLDLGGFNLFHSFPTEITSLAQLRYLAVRARMPDVPKSIVNLRNLETLVWTDIQRDLELPSNVWCLRKLRHLHVYGNGGFAGLRFEGKPDCTGIRLHDLATCSTLKLLDKDIEKAMNKFPRIRKLKLVLLVSGTGSGSSAAVNFHMLDELEWLHLKLDWWSSWAYINFTFPSRLKKLTIQRFHWGLGLGLELASLQVLKLRDIKFPEGIWEMKEEKLPNLKCFKLRDSDIIRWRSYSCDHFPRLEILELGACYLLKELPVCLGAISTLRLIQVRHCRFLDRDLLKDIEDAQKRNGNKRFNIFVSPIARERYQPL